ncbi:hypothetical protein [Shewanella denitrificans]|jgi:hypothetical protein|uniref:hypothetical protein n=1 Tax=Shewanella denitrificans TaxID=192073 RepID=UPI0002FCE983|nr:hypothetical protein [Shewanella denitrificans]
MNKILIALAMTSLLMVPTLSFSVQAEETPVLTSSGSENVPNGGDNKCPQGVGACSVHK